MHVFKNILLVIKKPKVCVINCQCFFAEDFSFNKFCYIILKLQINLVYF